MEYSWEILLIDDFSGGTHEQLCMSIMNGLALKVFLIISFFNKMILWGCSPEVHK